MSLPTPGGDANTWGSMLNTFLEQALLNQGGASDGTLVTTATNPNTSLPNTNLSSGSQPGLVQLAGDLAGSGGTAFSPALTAILGSGGTIGSGVSIPIITYDTKGRITAVGSTSISSPGSFSIDGGSSSTTFSGTLKIDFGGSS